VFPITPSISKKATFFAVFGKLSVYEKDDFNLPTSETSPILMFRVIGFV
jgi:hypothetical protein